MPAASSAATSTRAIRPHSSLAPLWYSAIPIITVPTSTLVAPYAATAPVSP